MMASLWDEGWLAVDDRFGEACVRSESRPHGGVPLGHGRAYRVGEGGFLRRRRHAGGKAFIHPAREGARTGGLVRFRVDEPEFLFSEGAGDVERIEEAAVGRLRPKGDLGGNSGFYAYSSPLPWFPT